MLRVLLVESELEEARFIQEVVSEIEDERWLRDWVRIELTHVASWSEAEGVLAGGTLDLVLLNPDLADTRGADTFRRSQQAAPDTPVILLVNSSDEALALKLIREGAQDFITRKQMDCGSLAHALRNAIPRHRVLAAARSAVQLDSLTGLLNCTGFTALGYRDRKLAERLNRRWMLLIAEPRNLTEIAAAQGEQRRDLELVEAADYLRSIAGPTDLLARIDDRHFAMTLFDSDAETVEEAWMRVRNATAQRRIEVGVSIFDCTRPLSLDAMLQQAVQDLAPGQRSQQRAVGAA